MTDADATARETFIAGQVAALAPLDFLVVGVPSPPFDAVQVLREEDGSLAVEVSARDELSPYSPEQVAALARLGLTPAASDTAEGVGGGFKTGVAPPTPEAAAALVDGVLESVLGVSPSTAVDVRHGSAREFRLAEHKIAEMRALIEPVVSSINGGKAPERDGDGDYVLDLGHVRVFVAPRALPGRPPPIIRVFAITNAGMTLTSELGLFLSRLNFSLMFGRFSIDADNSAIWFDETLLGDHVTPDELRFTVDMVASTANEWDQKIAAQFGGQTRPPVPTAQAGQGDLASPPPNPKPGQGGYL
ncbi:MAG TPA: YbjN domain-containing protein [Acidimicrobiales bacterium]|nr:YbjN domain-containing protein [Acidimicrobiales bacterium]